MTEYTDEIRTCIRPGCDNAFRVKVKGQTQLYCGKSCRTRDHHESTPKSRAQMAQWQRDYYYRNLAARQAAARVRRRMRCECGQRKAAASDPMCADCAALGTVGRMTWERAEHRYDAIFR